ncbi:MAG TPA: peptide-methionine (S)-S-oxide reductase MsrA [Candidatus Krumholzibacteria bacterium]
MRSPQKLIRALAAVIAIGCAALAHAADKKTSTATFAGGCFWCMEASLDFVKGVKSTTSGYAGGTGKNPTYHNYADTGYTEAVQVEYDPSKITYEELLLAFWHNIDPTSCDGQFCDRGDQYRPEIFYHDAAQKAAAEASKKEVEKKFGMVPVKVTALTTFYPAEEYHQDYYQKNPENYHSYRTGCGRDRRLQQLWGDEAGKAHASK